MKGSKNKKTVPLLSSVELERAYADILQLDPSKVEHLLQLKVYLQQTGRDWIDELVERQQTSVDVIHQPDDLEQADLNNEDIAQDEDVLDYELAVFFYLVSCN